MTKKKRREGTISKKIRHVKSHEDEKLERVLIENFVSLQKVMTNLSIKFDALAGQISKLLNLFEISAKALAGKPFEEEGKNINKIHDKVDNLLEQNKIMARGLALLHESQGRGETQESSQRGFGPNLQGYQRSISARDTQEEAQPLPG